MEGHAEGSPAWIAIKHKIRVVSCAKLLSTAIKSINSGTSVSSLFAVR